MSNKNVYIIAGPNGSGKTTFERKNGHIEAIDEVLFGIIKKDVK